MTPVSPREPASYGTGSESPALDQLFTRLDPAFAAAYQNLCLASQGLQALDPKVRELVNFGLNICITTLNADGARRHLAAARDLGATTEELVTVCELVYLVGIHSVMLAGPILVEELDAAGLPSYGSGDIDRNAIRDRYVADRGNFPPPFEATLSLHPAFVDAYRELSAAPIRSRGLEPKVMELIVLALDAATTHLHAAGTRAHLRAALAAGASAGEVLEILELASTLAIHGTNLGASLLAELDSQPSTNAKTG